MTAKLNDAKPMTRSKMTTFGVFLMSFLTIIACDRRSASVGKPDKKELPIQEGWNQEVQVTRNGLPAAVIHFGHMQQFAGKRQTSFDENIKVEFFSKNGLHASTLTAESGRMNEVRESLYAFGNVLVRTVDGRTLRTDSLRWDSQELKIFANSDVVLTTAEGDSLFGKGFEADESLENWKMTKAQGVTGKPFSLEGSGARPKQRSETKDAADSSAFASAKKSVGDSLK